MIFHSLTIEEEISADTDVIFLIPFNNNCKYEYTLYRIPDMKLNVYLCSKNHRQNIQVHMHTCRISLYYYKLRLHDRGYLSIHRYLRCSETKRIKIFLQERKKHLEIEMAFLSFFNFNNYVNILYNLCLDKSKTTLKCHYRKKQNKFLATWSGEKVLHIHLGRIRLGSIRL